MFATFSKIFLQKDRYLSDYVVGECLTYLFGKFLIKSEKNLKNFVLDTFKWNAKNFYFDSPLHVSKGIPAQTCIRGGGGQTPPLKARVFVLGTFSNSACP